MYLKKINPFQLTIIGASYKGSQHKQVEKVKTQSVYRINIMEAYSLLYLDLCFSTKFEPKLDSQNFIL